MKQTKLWHNSEQMIKNKKGILFSLGGRNIPLWGVLNPWHHQLKGHEWVSSGSWWWTGKPGVLQSEGSQRVGHNWATELNWNPWRREDNSRTLLHSSIKDIYRASLVVQWLKIHLALQESQMGSVVRDDPTHFGAIKSGGPNHWACALEPVSPNYWSPQG